MNNELIFIGEIKTPYNTLADCPHNISFDGPLCEILIEEKYKDGLVGLKAEAHILVLYWLDGAERTVTIGPSHGGPSIHGTFNRRTPHRPNPIGAAVVKIEKIQDTTIVVKGLDCLSGTKLLDIKPAIFKEL